MKHLLATSISIALLSLGLAGCGEKQATKEVTSDAFVTIQGQDLIKPDGTKLFIMGTNLGNWLNPEGYMFKFNKTNSGRFINEMFCQLVGPDFTADFWKAFKDNYVTREDIRFIKEQGANTIRLPFHYKLFTDEDYMGLTAAQDGFARVDSLVEWCRESDLYLILDMHDAPGGQTGDNIDDSYGYPWLFDSEVSQQLYCDIWRRIADRYKNEPVILGYELFNEPIAPYFENMEELNGKLEDVYKKGVAAIREASINRIVREAGIPRGSFYMYFRDKEDLFHYLMEESINEMLMVFEEALHSQGGDIFAALPAMYDHLRSRRSADRSLGGMGMMSAIVNRNDGLQKGGLLEFLDPDRILKRMKDCVNPDLLDLREPEDLNCILRMLIVLIVPIMYNGIRPETDPEDREKLQHALEILRRGMGAKTHPAQRS